MHTTILLNDNWYFSKGNIKPEEFKKENFELLNLPHTFNAEDGQDGGNDYYRGYATYVKQFTKASEAEDLYLEFKGVGQSCEVYLNNQLLGRHDGGYSTFRFNITKYVQDENTLVVILNNNVNERVYPQTADFTFYGGIYRDVSLFAVNKEHFDLLDHGSNGIKVTPILKEGKALVEVETKVTGGDEVRLRVDDIKVNVPVINNIAKGTIEINNPHLWDGLNDPFLYELVAQLFSNGERKACTNVKFGIREFHIDPDKGFYLNGKEYPLRGVSKHQDRLGVGNAVSKENLREDIEIIKELGANTIRLAHYQHDQYFYDLCDEAGMVVWAEIPYISRHMPEGKENTLSQMEELIKQNYNHPSIVCWGLSNEITIGGGAESETLLNNHRELNDLCHKLDNTRLTTMAHVMNQDPHGSIIDIPDIASYNLYFGWYAPDTNRNAIFFDTFHKEHPNHCIGLSEYGADASPYLHTPKPKRGDYTEEYQCVYHEDLIKIINDRPYLWATHVWNMFDFAADARKEGGNPGKNQKGLVTMDRKLKKDSFYLYKSYWNKDDKFVHICGRRYINRHEDITEVKVYSNEDEVTLYVDDKQFETKKGNNIFIFNVPISGKHKFKAVSKSSSDEIEIVHVKEKDESYILEVSGAMNWFDDSQMKADHYSLGDTVGDLMKNEEAKKIVMNLFDSMKTKDSTMDGLSQDKDKLIEAMSEMSLGTIITIGNVSTTAEDIKRLNDALQKIKK